MSRMKIDPLTFAVTLGTIWAAHDLADHVVQTDHQAGSKADRELHVWAPAMAGHIGGYQFTQAVALAITLRATELKPSWSALITGSLISAASHAFLDRRWPVRAILRRTGSPEFAQMTTPICGVYQADQALHHSCLWVAALVMAAQR
jgi:hypothetical protein